MDSILILQVRRVTSINFILLVHACNEDTGLQKLVKINHHLRENAMILNQILSTSISRKCMEISVENFNVNIGD